MMRSQKKSALIVVQVVVLVALLLLIHRLAEQDQQQQLSRVLLPPEHADSIIVESSDTQLVFVRHAAGWHMTEPLQGAAKQQRIAPLLSLLSLPDAQRYALDQINLAELGLAPAQALISINNINIELGDLSAAGDKRYMRVDDGVYLIDDLILPLISSAAESFLDAPQE